MVKNIILILCILVSFTSCGIFLQTPFPDELIYWKNSVPVEGIGLYEYANLYYMDSYVFLYIQQQNNANKLFIFTEDLKQIDSQDIYFSCDTFAMKEADSYYLIGNGRYEITDTGIIVHPNSGLNLPEGVQTPPYGYGFSYNGLNYYLWWDHTENALKYYQFGSSWGLITSNSIVLNDYYEIKALYYHPNATFPGNSQVVIFFEKNNNYNNSYIEVATIPVIYFETDLNNYYYFPGYMAEDTVLLSSTDAKYCYYTGDGFVIQEHSGTYVRYDLRGNFIKTLSSEGGDRTEIYSLDGKSRYIFSEQYMRLMKASVWW